jgi:hypothetical protein
MHTKINVTQLEIFIAENKAVLHSTHSKLYTGIFGQHDLG